MNVSLPKLKAAVLFFAENTNPQYLGEVKLMKLLYFLDFQHIKQYGSPVIGDEYYCLQMGPVPTVSKNLIDDLANDPENSVLADTVQVQTPSGTVMKKIVPVRSFTEADSKVFTESELDILNFVAKKFGDSPTSSIVSASHAEAPWKESKQPNKIPYELAAHDSDSKFDEEELKFLTSL